MSLADIAAAATRQDNHHQLADWLEKDDPDLSSVNYGVAMIIYQSLLAHPATPMSSAKYREYYPIALACIKKNLNIPN